MKTYNKIKKDEDLDQDESGPSAGGTSFIERNILFDKIHSEDDDMGLPKDDEDDLISKKRLDLKS